MPQEELVTFLQAGEKVVVTGPGRLELTIPKAMAAAGGKGAAAAGAAGTGTAAAGGTMAAGAAAQPSILAGGGSIAQPWTASMASGKVLGLNLAAINPWLLLGVGAIGGYLFMRKKRLFF